MAVWKKDGEWIYEYFDLDTPAIEFDAFALIVNLWNSKRQGSKLPSWSDFDFYDFKGWHGRVAKGTFLSNPFDYRIDLYGIDFVSLEGFDETGFKGTELVKLDRATEEDMVFYEWIRKNSYISRTRGNYPIAGQVNRWADILELPLSANGKTITHSMDFLLKT